jgi:hypothetical protein
MDGMCSTFEDIKTLVQFLWETSKEEIAWDRNVAGRIISKLTLETV